MPMDVVRYLGVRLGPELIILLQHSEGHWSRKLKPVPLSTERVH
jgi:hypothetical protein